MEQRLFSGKNRIRLSYGAAYGIYGSVLPFLPLILREQGLSDSQIGLVFMGPGVGAALGPLVLSHFADRRSEPRVLLAVLLVFTAITVQLWQVFHATLPAFIVAVACFSFLVPVISLLDSYSLRFISERAQEDSLSLQTLRVWGSIGFVVPSLALTLLQFAIPISGFAFLSLGTCSALVGAFASLGLPKLLHLPTVRRLPSFDALRFAFRAPLRPVFLAMMFAGIGLAMFYIILPRYLQELGCKPVQIGLITNVGVIAEIFLMYATVSAIERIGERVVVFAGLVALFIRLSLMAGVSYLPLIILSQVLHAPMVVGCFVAAPILLAKSVEMSLRYSIQGLYTTIVFGLTRILGGAVFSWSMSLSGVSGLAALKISSGAAAGLIAIGIGFMAAGAGLPADETPKHSY